MEIIAFTDIPESLVEAINKKIDDKDLRTWRRVLNKKNEVLYSHSPDQWDERAMPKPKINKNNVSFTIRWWKKNGEPEEPVKGYILGRFIEILIVHFSAYFSKIEIIK